MRYLLLFILLFTTCYLPFVPLLHDNPTNKRQILTSNITDYFSTNPLLERKVREVVSTMSDEQLAGQVLMPAWERNTRLGTVEAWVCQQHAGGIMLNRHTPTSTTAQEIKKLQQVAKQCGHTLPLFISMDAEPTLIAWDMRLQQLAPIMDTAASLKDAGAVTRSADIIHQELNKMGVTVNFAPVVDASANKAIISARSFGGDSANIQRLSHAFNANALEHNIIPTIKHFPGHGMVTGDSHKGLVTALGTLPELSNFALDRQGSPSDMAVPMVMVGHIAVSGGEYDTAGIPATLSRRASTELLRGELGFTGLVVTDAMNMGAVSNLQNTTLRALEAGADIVLMPKNTSRAHQAIVTHMQQDQNFKKMIVEKVSRITKLKLAQKWARK